MATNVILLLPAGKSPGNTTRTKSPVLQVSSSWKMPHTAVDSGLSCMSFPVRPPGCSSQSSLTLMYSVWTFLPNSSAAEMST